jgi:hypothetical protein
LYSAYYFTSFHNKIVFKIFIENLETHVQTRDTFNLIQPQLNINPSSSF